jgi:hypothetical protein
MIDPTKREAGGSHVAPEPLGVALQCCEKVRAIMKHPEDGERRRSHTRSQSVAEQVRPALLAQQRDHVRSACGVSSCCASQRLPERRVDHIHLKPHAPVTLLPTPACHAPCGSPPTVTLPARPMAGQPLAHCAADVAVPRQ